MNPLCLLASRFGVLARLASVLALVAASLVAQEPRLANVSTRARVGTGGDVLTTGFFVSGTAPKQVVIRAIGPTLATSFGVTGALADPMLRVFRAGSDSPLQTNDNWVAADAATFAAVGAFSLAVGSRDAALVMTLQPGSYTAQVSGVGNTTGEAIVEVYEVGAPAGKFLNLSTRAQVGGAAGTLAPGFVVSPGGGTRKLLIRAAGPQLGLPTASGGFGLGGSLSNPTISLVRTSAPAGPVASNDNWSTPVLPQTTTAEALRAAFTQAGAFNFAANSNDAALLVDVPPGNYAVQVNGVGTATGIALVEIYDLSPAAPPTITLAALKSTADETGSKNGEFVFTRSGGSLDALTVRYAVGGSAVNGDDFVQLPGSIVIPAGATSVTLPLLPNPDLQTEGNDTVVVTLLTDPNYLVGQNSVATVTITDSPATLYVANIRAETSATNSTASGTATILLSADGSLAAINLNVSNLSSPVTSAHLRINPTGDFVFNLPYSSAGSAQWLFTPVGNYTSAQLREALRTGNIYLGVDTARYPQGEVRGTFVQGAGSRTFSTPAATPAVSLDNVTVTDAARLLTQATFGPTVAEIDRLKGGSIDAWITEQMAVPYSTHRAATVADRTTFGGSSSFTNWNAIHPPNRQSAWWKLALTAPDQLRQRVAFALSQIFVVSDVALGDDSRAEPLAHYYDILGRHAFGNFRTLLEEVTLSPMMGEYLSHLRNAKATYDSSGAVLTTPDENYAREIMQLFTIGLVQLQPDGTLVLGDDGLPIPTYNQTTITEMAKVFTGWAYPSTNLNNFRTAGANHFSPLQLFPAFHEDGPKNLAPVLDTPIPAGQGGTRDLQIALDALFNHPNTPPFISKLLIQRLVTSNPSPGYVYRVAEKFRNNGSGTRGDLGAVVRAILTDYEARSPDVAANVAFGKLKEPILRLTGLLRAFNASSASGRFLGYHHTVDSQTITGSTPRPATAEQINRAPNTFSATRLDGVQGSIAQAALRSPTVFNFYHADYVLPGPLAAAGLVVPEFEITDDNFAINVPNFLRTFVNATVPNTPAGPYTITLDTAAEQALLSDVPALLDRLSLVLTANTLTPATRTRIAEALSRLPTTTSAVDRAKTAILLVLTSPAAAVQK
jgi:uncharacterized protein (DUF1800 family)